MGLSEDQKAMLRLLAQREQGYEDIAALMGLSVGQVRERVGDALAQLEDEGKAAPPVPRDEPPARELRPAGPVPGDDVSSSQAAGETPSPAPPAGGSPVEAAEKGQGSSPGERAPVSRGGGAGSGPPRVSLPSSNGARAAVGAGIAAVVLVVVILIVGGGGGGSSDSTTASNSSGNETSSEAENTSSGGAKQVTKAVLSSVDGSDATGVAIFGRVKNSLALQVEAEGLKPSGSGHSYTVWLAQSAQKMLPLASTEVAEDGRIGAQFAVPTEVLAYLANETFRQIVVTETEDSALKASLKKATGEKQAPEYTGTAVLEGTVSGPIVGAAG